MHLPIRPVLAFAFLASTAFLIAPAPVLRAQEDKMPAHEMGAMKTTNAAETWGEINGLREELKAQIVAKKS